MYSKFKPLLYLILSVLCACQHSRTSNSKGVGGVPTSVKLPAKPDSQNLAIFLSINKFDDLYWKPLKWANNDAEELARKLKKNGSFDKIVHLPTTKKELIKKLKQISAAPATENIEYNSLLFYISTHGTLYRDRERENRQTIVLKDSHHNELNSTTFSHKYLRKWFNDFPSTKKVLVLATCNSGFGKSRLVGDIEKEISGNKGPTYKPFEMVSETAIITSAASYREIAREDDRLKHDIYTYYFIEALEKGDRNLDGAVVVSEAHDYSRRRTYEFSKGRQLPTAESKIMGTDNIVLAGTFSNKPIPTLFSYGKRYSGLDIYVDGKKGGRLPLGVAVKPGVHEITLRNPNEDKGEPVEFTRKNISRSITLEELFTLKHTLTLKSGQSKFYNTGDNTLWKLNEVIVNSLNYTHLFNEYVGVNLLYTFASKEKKYEASAYGTGISYIPYRLRRFNIKVFSNILRNKILLITEDGQRIKSEDMEYNFGMELNWRPFRNENLAFSAGVENSNTSISIKSKNPVKLKQSLVGFSIGLGWHF